MKLERKCGNDTVQVAVPQRQRAGRTGKANKRLVKNDSREFNHSLELYKYIPIKTLNIT